jgi:cytochrome c biogenesis protein CcmG, thiol:disulfide interchange protein DsbE
MKKSIVFLCFICFLTSLQVASAQDKTIPTSLKLKKIDGNEWIDLTEQLNTEGATIISFWATWCKPCLSELNAIQEEYEAWQKDTKVKLIAISIDDSRSSDRVKGFVKTRGWDFEVLVDLNGDANRALGVNSVVPYTFILDKDKKIVYTHTSYLAGDEQKYLEIITQIANNEPIKR